MAQFEIEFDDFVRGMDGTSCTHQWNGTVLTITSASGTTSVDLKGEKGDSGELKVDETINEMLSTKADEVTVVNLEARFDEYLEGYSDEDIDSLLD